MLSFTNNLEDMNGNKSIVTTYANKIIRYQEPLLINNISNNVYDTVSFKDVILLLQVL